MGDARFDPAYRRVSEARDRHEVLRALTDVEVVQALAAASRAHDVFLANVLATEAENRMRRAGVTAARAPECILTIDAQGRIVYVNEAALALLGCRRQDLMGRIAWEAIDVFETSGPLMPRVMRPSWRALVEGHDARGEADVRCATGQKVRCVYLAAPIVRECGTEGAVVVFHRADPSL